MDGDFTQTGTGRLRMDDPDGPDRLNVGGLATLAGRRSSWPRTATRTWWSS